MSPVIAEISKRYNQNLKIKAKKSLGQNFLTNQNIPNQIANHVGLIEDESVIEIGPGLGVLSEAIAAICQPAKLILVEKDRELIPQLEALKHKYNNPGSIQIINSDALSIDEQKLLMGYNGKTRIIANLPYNISTELLFKWLEIIQFFASITIMVQLEVAKRIVSLPKNKSYGWISIISQLLCNTEIIMQISPENFWPAPKVMSAVVHLVPRDNVIPHDKAKLKKLVKTAFLHRRKTLRNTISEMVSWEEAAKIHVYPQMRPEELSVEQWADLSLLPQI